MTPGERIRSRREDVGMTQCQLAEATGLPQSHISRIERGRLRPVRRTIAKINAALHAADTKGRKDTMTDDLDLCCACCGSPLEPLNLPPSDDVPMLRARANPRTGGMDGWIVEQYEPELDTWLIVAEGLEEPTARAFAASFLLLAAAQQASRYGPFPAEVQVRLHAAITLSTGERMRQRHAEWRQRQSKA